VSQIEPKGHIFTLPLIGVGVVAQREGKVAMGLRRYKGESVWSLPGGKVEPFELIVCCGQRELTEETGLVADELKVFAIYEFIEQEEYHSITFGAVSHSITGELSNLEPQIFAAWNWFDLTCLPSPLFPPSYHLLRAYGTAMKMALKMPEFDSAMIAHGHTVTAPKHIGPKSIDL
jgi:8-oxo-dGTP diphosphatase